MEDKRKDKLATVVIPIKVKKECTGLKVDVNSHLAFFQHFSA